MHVAFVGELTRSGEGAATPDLAHLVGRLPRGFFYDSFPGTLPIWGRIKSYLIMASRYEYWLAICQSYLPSSRGQRATAGSSQQRRCLS